LRFFFFLPPFNGFSLARCIDSANKFKYPFEPFIVLFCNAASIGSSTSRCGGLGGFGGEIDGGRTEAGRRRAEAGRGFVGGTGICGCLEDSGFPLRDADGRAEAGRGFVGGTGICGCLEDSGFPLCDADGRAEAGRGFVGGTGICGCLGDSGFLLFLDKYSSGNRGSLRGNLGLFNSDIVYYNNEIFYL